MMKQWISRNKSLVTTVTSGSLVAVLVATVAITSGGYSAQRMDLTDASVWVANGSESVIGRANTEVLELNTVVSSTGTELDVIQDGANVLLFDRSNNKVDIVDAATSTVVDSAAMPTEAPELHLAGENVVVHSTDTGAVWILPFEQLADFDAAAEPTLSLGSNSVASVSPSGVLFAYSADTEKVYRLNAADSGAVAESEDVGGEMSAGSVLITSVDERWILLDTGADRIYQDGRTIDLGGVIAPTDALALQQPTASGSRVLVASESGLVSVPLDGGAPSSLVSGQSGNPVAPVILAGCTYAAWSGGNVWRQCAGDDAGALTPMEGVSDGSRRLVFATNGGRIVLSDPA
ncbi:MAG: fibronectin type protein, partial [Homoserinimonas sp.]|nr:fibronectin type protein [Homoserinimonas sp.]